MSISYNTLTFVNSYLIVKVQLHNLTASKIETRTVLLFTTYNVLCILIKVNWASISKVASNQNKTICYAPNPEIVVGIVYEGFGHGIDWSV